MLYSQPWPKQGSMRNGACSPQRRWERRTSVSGFSYLPTAEKHGSAIRPTPVANDDNKSPEAHLAMKARMKGGPRSEATSLQVVSQMWPTPNTPNGGRALAPEYVATKGKTPDGKRQVGLEQVTAIWPTPRASASENRNTQSCPSHGITHGRTLAGEAGSWARPGANDWKGSSEPGQRRGQLSEQAECLFTHPRETTGTVGLTSSIAGPGSLPPSLTAWIGSRCPGTLADFCGALLQGETGASVAETLGSLPSELREAFAKKRLNPRFAAWLMGLPPDWPNVDAVIDPTSFAQWATAATHSLRLLLSGCYGIGRLESEVHDAAA